VKQIEDLAATLGLVVVPPSRRKSDPVLSQIPFDGPFCFLSLKPEEELRTYGKLNGYCDVFDPLISFLRPQFVNNELTLGRLEHQEDKELLRITKPLNLKVEKYIKNNWGATPYGQYVGPDAMEKLNEGARIRIFPEGVKLTVKER
jgi:hypothetical protein